MLHRASQAHFSRDAPASADELGQSPRVAPPALLLRKRADVKE